MFFTVEAFEEALAEERKMATSTIGVRGIAGYASPTFKLEAANISVGI